MDIIATIKSMYGRTAPYAKTYWHEWTVYAPVRGIQGKWLFGPILRRKGANGWEYKSKPGDWRDDAW